MHLHSTQELQGWPPLGFLLLIRNEEEQAEGGKRKAVRKQKPQRRFEGQQAGFEKSIRTSCSSEARGPPCCEILVCPTLEGRRIDIKSSLSGFAKDACGAAGDDRCHIPFIPLHGMMTAKMMIMTNDDNGNT